MANIFNQVRDLTEKLRRQAGGAVSRIQQTPYGRLATQAQRAIQFKPKDGYRAGAQRVSQAIRTQPREFSPFTATQGVPMPVQQFRGSALQGLTFGGLKNNLPAPNGIAQNVGSFAGHAVGFIPSFNAATGIIGGTTRNIATLPRAGRAAIDLLAGSSALAATTPGGIKERLGVFNRDVKDPLSLGMSAAFPFAGLAVGKQASGFAKMAKFEGIDKKLRAEISDLVARIQPTKLKKVIEEGGNSRLGDFFEHAGLYKQYPQLKNLRVELKPIGEAQGTFNPRTFSITLDSSLKSNEMRSTLLHEIQHTIQEIEGFAKGGSEQMFTKSMKLTPVPKGVVDILFENKPRARVYLGGGGAITKDKLHLVEGKQLFLREPDILQYKKLAGEIEARAVERRSNLTSAQRKQLPFYEAEMKASGIKPEDVITRFDSGVSAKSPLAKKASKYKSAEGIKAYHQFSGQDTTFRAGRDLSKAKRVYSQAEEGIYFSPDKELLKAKYGKGGGKMVEVNLDMKKPLDLGSNDAMYYDGRKINYGDLVVDNFRREMRGEKPLPEPDILLTKITKKSKDWLQKQGYDGVIGNTGKENMHVMPEYVVFDKKQILTLPTQAKGVSPQTGKLPQKELKGRISGQAKLKAQLSSLTSKEGSQVDVPSTSIIPEKGKLNINRLNVEGEGKQVLKSIEDEVMPTVIGNKEVVEAAKTATGAKRAISDSQMKNLLAQQLKNRQKVVDLTTRYNQAKAGGASDLELGKIMLEMAEQSRVARQGGTLAGRLLQAQNIVADTSASPMQKVLALLDHAGVKSEKYLADSVRVDWNNAKEVVDFYRKYVPPKFTDVIDEIRYTNMLSSPLTHIINITSNALQTAVVTPVEKTLTGLLDFGKSKLTGKEREYYASAGLDYSKGYVQSLPKAWDKFKKILSGKEISIKPDFEGRIPISTKGKLKAYTTPLRALEAADQFFQTLVAGGVTEELGKAPKQLGKLKVAEKAQKEATYRLFRQAFDPDGKLGQGGVLKLFDKWNSGIAQLRRLPGGKWILPFLQTPTNILKQGVEYSPLGLTTIPGAKAPIEQLSKSMIGSTVFLTFYGLAKNGLVQWETPSNAKEREAFYAAGLQPYSVKIGNKWVSYSKLGPLSYPVAMGAAIANAERENPDDKAISNVSKGAMGMLKFFGDQSYVRSIGDLVDAIQGGYNVSSKALQSEGANLLNQMVPYRSFQTWLGRTIDPVYRKASNFGEKIKKDIPLIGQSLQPYYGPDGQPSKRDNPLLNAITPYKVSQEKPEVGNYKLASAKGLHGLLKAAPTREAQVAILKQAREKGYLTSGTKAQLKKLNKQSSLGMTKQEVKLQSSSVDNRARTIRDKLVKFKTREEQRAYIKDLESKGILTKSVKEELRRLNGQTR
jgi:hypothetical protein